MTEMENLIVESIKQSTAAVFSTMLDAEAVFEGAAIEKRTPEASDGVVSFIGMAGAWAGAGSLVCSPVMACRVSARMLMAEFPAVDDEVLDAVAELTNMIIGGVKTDLEPRLGPLGLSIPTVVYGKNFKAKGAGIDEWVGATFDWEGERLAVKVCLAPTAAPQAKARPAGHPYAVEV
ncbi:MAG TPA: chemotaxis protein CheX [Bryobacteraceae bacterium]|nr:chemotaxis protein CheX [Bryobacteraceae bacterium]